MEAASDLTAAVAAAASVAPRFHTGSDEEVLADARAVEELGRLADALRLSVAAQLEQRSRKSLGEESLASRNNARDGVELVQHLTGVSHATARMRVGLGSALAPAVGLTGELLPGKYPGLAAAVEAGEVGIEAARLVVNSVRSLRLRAEADAVDAMLESLTDTARRVGVEVLREVADHWVLALDPDGAEPKERVQRRKRAARLGKTLADGTTMLSVVLTPEDLAFIRELFQSQRRGTLLVRTTPGGDETCEETDPEWREGEGPDGDPRSRAQQDHDSLLDFLHLGAGAATRGEGTVAEAQETVVTITVDELEHRHGQGWAPGVMAGLPIPVIERRTCTGGIRLLVTGKDGEALYLSRSRRVFSSAQRKALTVAAGGRCQYPGCRTPAPFLEAHHADWWHRDGGLTDIDNGIMLCSYHHHLIHATHAPVDIRHVNGDLYIVPRSWRGPVQEHQRRQAGPLRDPGLDRLRRRHDPDRNPFAA